MSEIPLFPEPLPRWAYRPDERAPARMRALTAYGPARLSTVISTDPAVRECRQLTGDRNRSLGSAPCPRLRACLNLAVPQSWLSWHWLRRPHQADSPGLGHLSPARSGLPFY